MLWCDVICIDQDNLEEKSAQVAKMFVIFKRATRVLAWLGLEDEDTAFLNYFPPAVGSKWSDRLSASHSLAELSKSRHREAAEQFVGWMATFFRRQWFHRLWVRQEVAAARELILRYGSAKVNFYEHLKRVDMILSVFKEDVGSLGPSVAQSIPRSLFILRTDFWFLQKSGDECHQWLKILYEAERFGASDQWDRIYAMFILADSSVQIMKGTYTYRNPIDETYGTDYSKSILAVYTDFARNLIQRTGHLGLLWFYEERDLETSRLPSWVPDWSVIGRRTHGYGEERDPFIGKRTLSPAENPYHEQKMLQKRRGRTRDRSPGNRKRSRNYSKHELEITGHVFASNMSRVPFNGKTSKLLLNWAQAS
ncbi:MAG: hypothetical protein Q9218_001332 [Villophora microphyllina]